MISCLDYSCGFGNFMFRKTRCRYVQQLHKRYLIVERFRVQKSALTKPVFCRELNISHIRYIEGQEAEKDAEVQLMDYIIVGTFEPKKFRVRRRNRTKPEKGVRIYEDFTLQGLNGTGRQRGTGIGRSIAASKFKKISCSLSRLKEALMRGQIRIVYGFIVEVPPVAPNFKNLQCIYLVVSLIPDVLELEQTFYRYQRQVFRLENGR